jgi:microcystin-dependent protein
MADSYLGEIRIFAGNFAPVGWQLCDGTLLPISQYDALYALLGTTYGGDGATTFGVPDLRGRLAIGQGTGTNLTPRVMGQSFGTEIATVPQNGWPVHSHALMASSNTATSGTPGGNVLAATTTAVPLYDVKTNPKAFDARAVASVGGGLPHQNVMPSSCINFIISTSGFFPSRA